MISKNLNKCPFVLQSGMFLSFADLHGNLQPITSSTEPVKLQMFQQGNFNEVLLYSHPQCNHQFHLHTQLLLGHCVTANMVPFYEESSSSSCLLFHKFLLFDALHIHVLEQQSCADHMVLYHQGKHPYADGQIPCTVQCWLAPITMSKSFSENQSVARSYCEHFLIYKLVICITGGILSGSPG